jgi:hypothetical protein
MVGKRGRKMRRGGRRQKGRGKEQGCEEMADGYFKEEIQSFQVKKGGEGGRNRVRWRNGDSRRI